MNGTSSSIRARLTGAVIMSLLAGVSLADEGPKYTYAEVGVAHVEFDDFNNADGDQYGIGGSLTLTDMLHIFGSYAEGDVDSGGFSSIDTTTAQAGLGLNYAVSGTIDLVGRVAYVYAKAELNNFDVDDSGVGLSFGARAMVTPQIELDGGVSYVDFGDSNDTALELGAVYSFTEMFAVTANASFADNSSSIGAGLRLYLGQ